MTNKDCKGCVYEKIHDGLDSWAASIPLPCENCERNKPIIKDNYESITHPTQKKAKLTEAEMEEENG